ncbi:hypothetical protein RE628_20360 [Paenibacillus sp. D2_2]|uniref:hypothetical protein n=1 Tax=Paenibacillus sp. D2_2 TaxID=3073092 RepID=UPI00281692CE|nr:hypothetical protein [Paenibacillus sp. D2_2]WMT39725.1 hypothetical protein RE628_20360 [Paenibacillus sp. D2_2]
MNKSSFIISISGPSGSGKSTLVRQLKNRLSEAIAFYFDDYASTNKYPVDLIAWLNEGADPKLVMNPDFNRDLNELAQGRSVVLPINDQLLEPKKIIIVEEPFGRGREGMGELIDYSVCIDIPLEVALARRVLRGIQNANSSPVETLKNVEDYLLQYLMAVGSLYHVINMKVMSECELVISGLDPIEIMADKVIDELMKRNIQLFNEDSNNS